MYSPKHFVITSLSSKYIETSIKQLQKNLSTNRSSITSYYFSPNNSTFITPLEASESIVRKGEIKLTPKHQLQQQQQLIPFSDILHPQHINDIEEIKNQKLYKTIFAKSCIQKLKEYKEKNSNNKLNGNQNIRLFYKLSTRHLNKIDNTEKIKKKINLIQDKLCFIKRVYDYVYPQTIIRNVRCINSKRINKLKPIPHNDKVLNNSNISCNSDIYSISDFKKIRSISLTSKYPTPTNKEGGILGSSNGIQYLRFHRMKSSN